MINVRSQAYFGMTNSRLATQARVIIVALNVPQGISDFW